MLNIISTIAFPAVACAINRHYKAKSIDQTNFHKMQVIMVAIVISIGTGWLVDIVGRLVSATNTHLWHNTNCEILNHHGDIIYVPTIE